MISDVLTEAVQEIDYYLNDPVFHGAYQGETRERILKLREEMDYLRTQLEIYPRANFTVIDVIDTAITLLTHGPLYTNPQREEWSPSLALSIAQGKLNERYGKDLVVGHVQLLGDLYRRLPVDQQMNQTASLEILRQAREHLSRHVEEMRDPE